MDVYKKDLFRKIIMTVGVVLGLYLQWIGRATSGTTGLAIQFVSLAILLNVLWIYNRKFK